MFYKENIFGNWKIKGNEKNDNQIIIKETGFSKKKNISHL